VIYPYKTIKQFSQKLNEVNAVFCYNVLKQNKDTIMTSAAKLKSAAMEMDDFNPPPTYQSFERNAPSSPVCSTDPYRRTEETTNDKLKRLFTCCVKLQEEKTPLRISDFFKDRQRVSPASETSRSSPDSDSE